MIGKNSAAKNKRSPEWDRLSENDCPWCGSEINWREATTDNFGLFCWNCNFRIPYRQINKYNPGTRKFKLLKMDFFEVLRMLNNLPEEKRSEKFIEVKGLGRIDWNEAANYLRYPPSCRKDEEIRDFIAETLSLISPEEVFLSDLERKVHHLKSQGLNSRQVARELRVSIKKVNDIWIKV